MFTLSQHTYHLRRYVTGRPPVRFMADSADVFGIPGSFNRPRRLVAGYLTGYPWSESDWKRFAKAREVQIVQHDGIFEGDVLDVENGAATFDDIVPFIYHRRAVGYWRPTIYVSLGNFQRLRTITGKLRLGIEYDAWIAHWTGKPHEIPGAVATQYASHQGYDISVVYDPEWPHRVTPEPPPLAVTIGENA